MTIYYPFILSSLSISLPSFLSLLAVSQVKNFRLPLWKTQISRILRTDSESTYFLLGSSFQSFEKQILNLERKFTKEKVCICDLIEFWSNYLHFRVVSDFDLFKFGPFWRLELLCGEKIQFSFAFQLQIRILFKLSVRQISIFKHLSNFLWWVLSFCVYAWICSFC